MGFLNLSSKVFVIAYSSYISRKFHACGGGFRIHFPSLLQHPELVKVGKDVTIAAHAWLNCLQEEDHPTTLEIGDGCSIGRFAHINAYGRVMLEENVLVAERVHISDCSHLYHDPEVPIIQQGARFLAPVTIRRGAWIGSGAVILPGVEIGRNAVVGANSVVTKSVPENQVAVGIPARMREKGRNVDFCDESF